MIIIIKNVFTKIPNSKIQKGEVNMTTSSTLFYQPMKQLENNCYIPDLWDVNLLKYMPNKGFDQV